MTRVLIDLEPEEYEALIKIKQDKSWKELMLQVLQLDPEIVAKYERRKRVHEANKKITQCIAEIRHEVIYTELLEYIEILLKTLIEGSNKDLVKQIAEKIYNYATKEL